MLDQAKTMFSELPEGIDIENYLEVYLQNYLECFAKEHTKSYNKEERSFGGGVR